MYYALQDAFIWRKPLSVLRDSYITNKLAFRDLSTLGVFLDNHDVERVLNQLSKLSPEESKATLLNMLTYLYMSYGIPILYYGTEALFTGGKDPENREWFAPLNSHRASLDQTMIYYLKTLNSVRRDHRTYDLEPDWRLTDHGVLAFTKGDSILVVISNDQ